jgi:hypothetical protein
MRERAVTSPGFIFGALVLAAGILLFLDLQGFFDLGGIFRFWPLAVVGLGMACLIQPANTHRFLGVLLVAGGAVLQLGQFGLIRLEFGQLWPLILIGLGAVLLWQAIEAQAGPRSGSPGARFNRLAVFGGGEYVGADGFEGGETLAVFGGYKVDLRNAALAGPSATISATALWGGVEIRVPETWNVSAQGVGVFGGYSDHTRHPHDSANAPQLIISGLAIFGGVDIKN